VRLAFGGSDQQAVNHRSAQQFSLSTTGSPSPVGIYRRIMLLLSRPILAALGIFFFPANWNSPFWPVVGDIAQSDR
jgi:hypothetical protein